MATVKVTVTLEERQLQDIRRLVEDGQATSVSGFVQHAVTVGLHDVAGWKEMLGQALLDTGGPLTKKERALIDAEMAAATAPKRRKRRAA